MTPADVFNPDRWGPLSQREADMLEYAARKWSVYRLLLPERLDGLSALDVGCNTGYATCALAADGARPSVGIDLPEWALTLARKRASTLALPVTFQRNNVFRMATWLEESGFRQFDIVLGLGLVHRMMRPVRCLYNLCHASRDYVVIELRTSKAPWSELTFTAPRGDYATVWTCVPSLPWIRSQFKLAGFEVVAEVEHFANDRSIVVARRRPVAHIDHDVGIDECEDFSIVEMPIDHPSLDSMPSVPPGEEERWSHGGVLESVFDAATRRFDAALFVPLVWSRRRWGWLDGQHRLAIARALGHKQIRAYVQGAEDPISTGPHPAWEAVEHPYADEGAE